MCLPAPVFSVLPTYNYPTFQLAFVSIRTCVFKLKVWGSYIVQRRALCFAVVNYISIFIQLCNILRNLKAKLFHYCTRRIGKLCKMLRSTRAGRHVGLTSVYLPLISLLPIKWLIGPLAQVKLPQHTATEHIDGLVQDCSNSIAFAMELQLSYTKPSICAIAIIDTAVSD